MPIDTHSAWSEADLPRAGQPLPADTARDVCVVGAGIAGLTTAYRLAKEGKRVLVLEAKEKFGGGETEHTTAHLASVIDDRFGRLKSIRGTTNAKLAYQSHAAAIDTIEAIAQAENIDCDFARVDGYLFPGAQEKAAEGIDEEEKAVKDLGIPYERLDRAPVAALGGPCLRFPNQGQFQPLRYLAGLARAITARGGAIVTAALVEKVEGGSPCTVTLRGGRTLHAGAVVLATNTPINNGVAVNVKIAAYQTYVVTAEVPAGSVPRALYWDTEDPYHYVRLFAGRDPAGPDLLIVGGEDHKTGQAKDQAERWAKLEAWIRERFPQASAFRHRWSGEVFETLDGLALIGPEFGGAKNVYIATGDSGMGMTHGTIAGLLLCDLVLGRPNPWTDLYSPSRLPVAAAKTFVEENANMAAQFADHVTGGDVKDADAVMPGTGAVVRRGLTKVALYRDDAGTLHELSAICPHMKCVVRWNPGERTWDCPCHGSRFHADGRVLHGPAVDDLAPLTTETAAK